MMGLAHAKLIRGRAKLVVCTRGPEHDLEVYTQEFSFYSSTVHTCLLLRPSTSKAVLYLLPLRRPRAELGARVSWPSSLSSLRTMAALLLTLFPASLLPSSQPPASAYRTLSRRAALLPLLTAPAAVSAFPNPFANPEEEKRKAEKEAAEKQRLADKQAEFMRVRKERMAAEVRLQVVG